jgi:hypothetical protein
VIVLAVGLALSAPACGVAPVHPATGPEPFKIYTFPLTLPDRSLICAEAPFDPEPPCITLGRLRRMVRERSAE